MLKVIWPFIILCLVCWPGVCGGQSESSWKLEDKYSSIGRVYSLDRKTRIGTAFVAGRRHNIFTPAHVALADTLIYSPYNSDYSYRVCLKYILRDYDLAIYQRTGGSQPSTMEIGDIQRVLPGDKVFYFGWDSDHSLSVKSAIVEAKGTVLQTDNLVDFIEFPGQGIPGYSGGPVLNAEGDVVAMIVQAWDWKPIKDTLMVRILRAYSVDLLRVLEQDLDNRSKPDSITTGETLRLIDGIE